MPRDLSGAPSRRREWNAFMAGDWLGSDAITDLRRGLTGVRVPLPAGWRMRARVPRSRKVGPLSPQVASRTAPLAMSVWQSRGLELRSERESRAGCARPRALQ